MSRFTKRREIRRDLLNVGKIKYSRPLSRLLVPDSRLLADISRRFFPTFSCLPDDVSRLLVPVSRLPTFSVHRIIDWCNYAIDG